MTLYAAVFLWVVAVPFAAVYAAMRLKAKAGVGKSAATATAVAALALFGCYEAYRRSFRPEPFRPPRITLPIPSIKSTAPGTRRVLKPVRPRN